MRHANKKATASPHHHSTAASMVFGGGPNFRNIQVSKCTMRATFVVGAFLALRVGLTCGYVTPTGTFCCFRSEALFRYTDQVERVIKAYKKFEESKGSSRLLIGIPSRRMEEYGDGVSIQVDAFLEEWDTLMKVRREGYNDFQLREFLSEPNGYNLEVAKLSEFLPTCKAWATASRKLSESESNGGVLVEIPKLLKRESGVAKRIRRDFVKFTHPITTKPYNEQDIQSQSQVVQDEYKQLLDDHKYLISCGSDFGRFDTQRKKRYLKALRSVEDRWEIVLHRFHLMNVLNPDYVAQCDALLADYGLDERRYKKLHRQNLRRLRDGADYVPYDFTVPRKRPQPPQQQPQQPSIIARPFGVIRRLTSGRFQRLQEFVGRRILRRNRKATVED